MATVNWMIDQVPEAETDLGINIVEHVLIGTPASPLRKNAGSGKPHSTRAQLDLGQKDGGDGEIQDR